VDVIPVLFLDLDGTVRESRTGGFIDGPEDVALMEGREDAIRVWDGVVAGVTNQGGVAHGHKDLDQVLAENRRTRELFDEDPFATIQFSPFHEQGDHELFGYPSWSRKPDIGMLVMVEQWLMEHMGSMPDRDKSLMVGDRPEDEQCAQNADLPFMWAEEFFDATQ